MGGVYGCLLKVYRDVECGWGIVFMWHRYRVNYLGWWG